MGSKLESIGRTLAEAHRAESDMTLTNTSITTSGSSGAVEKRAPAALVEPEYDATKAFAGYDVFISYSRHDAAIVRQLASLLEAGGRRVFFDATVATGVARREEVRRAISRSTTFMVLIGSKIEPLQLDEIYLTAAREPGQQDRRIIPVLLPGSSTASVPEFLRAYQLVDLRLGLSAFDSAQLAAITDTSTNIHHTQVTAVLKNPYLGLRAFGEQDATFMFGREALIEQAMKRLHVRSVLAIVGPSASGKSSLVLAGVVPRLRRETGNDEAPAGDDR